MKNQLILSRAGLGTILFLCMLAISIIPLRAQESKQAAKQVETISGTVVDKDGEPLIGATIMSSNKHGAATDGDGNFTLSTSLPTTLTVSYIGYATKTVKVSNNKPLRIILDSSSQQLEEVVVVGYGMQKKETLTGSVAAVNQETISQTAAPNLTTALSGRLPGLTTLQTSGMPGVDDVTMYLRGASTTNGQNPLILIDGVPRDDIGSLDPNEVKSVSILKDASATAVFGVRGANGVILVTTRRGDVGKASVSVAANYSVQDFICRPTRIHSWEFAELRNQAFRNDGYAENQLPYTPYMIEMYKNGTDRVFYPDRDTYSEFFKKWAPQGRINVNVNGGNDKVTYFLNVGYLGQQGQLKTEKNTKLNYDPSFSNDRFNFRGNVDFNVLSNLKMSMNVASYLGKINSPGAGELFGNSRESMVTNAMSFIWGLDPTQPGPYTMPGYTLDDGTPVEPGLIMQQTGSAAGRNIYGDLNRRGYMKETNMNLNSSFTIDWGLDFITPGLSTKLLAAFDLKAYSQRKANCEYDSYAAEVAREEGGKCYYKAQTINKNDALILSKTAASYYYLNLQYSINYLREFGPNRVTGMLLFQRDNWQKYAADLPYNMLGIAARATYGYDNRYLAEVNLGYNGSEQFAKGHRFGLFPAVSLGWVVSNESFLRDNTFISNMKLRASYGKVGNDNLGSSRFLYLDNMVLAGGSTYVNIPSLGNNQYINISKLGNPNIGWEVAQKQNYGIDMTIFGNALSFSIDYFYENRDNILLTRSTVPQIQGVPLEVIPKVNMGKIHNQGIEFDATYKKRINKDLNFSINGNFAYNENKIDFIDEVKHGSDYAYAYNKTGYSIGQNWGLKIDTSNGNGYINTEKELEWAKNAYKIGTPRLGDFLYKDLNGDGYIDERDNAPIKYGTVPRITYGFGGNVKYRDFDFSMQFAGVGLVSQNYQGWGVNEIGLCGFYTEYHLNAWTPERYASGAKITYPALSTANSVSHRANDFFIMDRSFLRLKSIEFGYTLPKSLLKSIGMQKVRAFASATNPLTFKRMKTNVIDPEQTTYNTYPVTKMFTFGLNVTF